MWTLAALLAYFVKGLCGFANTLVFTGVMNFAGIPAEITPVELLLGYPANLVMIVQNRRALKVRIFGPLAVLVIAGALPGALLLKSADARWIKLLFGVLLMGLALDMHFGGGTKRSPSWMLLLVGVASGLLSGLFGVGALLAAYLGKTAGSGESFRANLCAVFLVENTFRLALYLSLGLMKKETLFLALRLLPAMALGLAAGTALARHGGEPLGRRILPAVLFLSGAALIVYQL